MTTAPTNARTGAQILVDQLTIQGVEHVFCVPGESYLAVLDAFHDAKINITVCRQEAGAGMMADASARLTGRPGIVFVTRGPGATNGAHAIHIAEHDSVPLIMFIGQVERGMRGRGAFQEMDYERYFASTVKWVTEIDDPQRIPEVVARAFHVALQGRPGPVVISLPEDMLVETASVADALRVEAAQAAPGTHDLARLTELLAQAKRPIAILGGSGWSPEACAQFRAFAEAFDLPVAASFRRTMLFNGEHANYAGELSLGANPALVKRVQRADLVLLIGGRLAEVPSQAYTLLDVPVPRQRLVHVHADAAELGRVYQPTLAINATPQGFCAALGTLSPPQTHPWSAETKAGRADYLAFSGLDTPIPGDVQLNQIMLWLRQRLPADAIVTNGAGNYTTWLGRYLRIRQFDGLLAPVSGSMGYGLPAAVGAKRLHPERMVVSFAGDGCFLMNGQEFATAVQYDLPIVVVVIDNGMYGTIRMHQEREYPGRVSATLLNSPDFAALARAYGGHGESVVKTEEFAPAFERALAAGKPAIVHVKIDRDAITPATTLTKIREAALKGR
ncbi:thiamine pyrophosphate-binding protein [Methylocella sp. CPCC 101449]|uniref:thiamine pyrophosphate-binding protein n=1 Tax=Methylocella sp. CPCC 101449 TaxID=2987531 RepID=UPI00289250F4|nr:thiamine pyrophosphate-binding protein [Methylocella sp. CPCC 101449]MDT2019753.1 thiamine pyrophosphate-binding protein [Methylocella sp. CPCC 101449]